MASRLIAGASAGAPIVPRLPLWRALLLLVCGLVGLAGSLSAQTLTLSTGADKSALAGISMRIFEEAFRRADLDVAFKPMPLQRAIEESNDGTTDGDLHRIADVVSLYPNLITVPTPINKVVVVLYGRSATLLQKSRADIAKLRVAFPRGTLLMRKYTQGMDASEARMYAGTFEMLLNGRVDVLMMSHVDTEAQIADGRLTTPLVMWPQVWASEPLFLVLHRRHAALVHRLDDALRQMQLEGLIDKYYDDGLRELKIRPLPATHVVDPGATLRSPS